jgi:hypothetical protein
MASRAQQQPQGLSQVSRRAMGMDGGSKQAGQGVYLCASLYREELVDLRERGAGARLVFPEQDPPRALLRDGDTAYYFIHTSMYIYADL